jgi:nicotinamide phosphoribosyltransferase
LLQKVNRDTQKFALKCSYAEVGSEEIEVRKSPLEMNEEGRMIPSFKVSKAGRLKLVREAGEFRTVAEKGEGKDLLETVFENGELKKSYTFEEIRENARVKSAVHV